jgi:hypothetical protein
LNGKNPFPTSAFRRARAETLPCWACGGYASYRGECAYCRAPQWYGRYSHQPVDGPGVYVLLSQCGMAKIGVSTVSVWERARRLCKLAGSPCWHAVCLEDAGYPVEKWLHRVLAETCDPGWARNEGLPHPSEWFWPTPALHTLIWDSDYLVDRLHPELIPEVAA